MNKFITEVEVCMYDNPIITYTQQGPCPIRDHVLSHFRCTHMYINCHNTMMYVECSPHMHNTLYTDSHMHRVQYDVYNMQTKCPSAICEENTLKSLDISKEGNEGASMSVGLAVM